MQGVAISYLNEGLSVIPINRFSKKPIVKWNEYKTERVSKELAQRWFTHYENRPDFNIAVVGGAVSGGLQILDFDYEAGEIFPKWMKSLLPTLAGALTVVETGKGYHVYFRVKEPRRSTKLSRTEEGLVLIELKGEGGYAIAPPSYHVGRNRNYAFWQGDFSSIPNLSGQEAEFLLRAAETFDRGGTVRSRHQEDRARKIRESRNGAATRTNEKVRDILSSFDMTDYARQYLGGKLEKENGEIRVLGNGGLFLRPDDGVWFCHSDDTGGGAIDLVGYQMFSNRWNRYDKEMFKKALVEAAKFAGVEL